MAKKFAAIDGFHTLYSKFSETVDNELREYYDITGTPLSNLVNHNTICFVTADNEDVDVYVAEHKIQAGERFIIVQNDIFSFYTDSEKEDENTWRPIYVNNEEILDEIKNGANINFVDGIGTTVSTVVTNEQLSIAYNIDVEELVTRIYTMVLAVVLPQIPEAPNDGRLDFIQKNSTTYTKEGSFPRDIDIKPNTVDFGCSHLEYDPSDPAISEEVEGNFSANTATDSIVRIHYKGTADRVDWYKEDENRAEPDPDHIFYNNRNNDTKAKKFVYIECLQDYFEPSGNYPYMLIKSDAQDLICEDSIVFITCSSKVSGTGTDARVLTDAEVFGNPEYYPGARFIWTGNKMYSANTWMPIFTRETEQYELKGITPPIGTNPYGGRLIFQGKGGITVDNTINDDNTLGIHDRIITIDGSGINTGGGGGKVYTTDVYVKQDIPIGGTHLGDKVLEEGLFAQWGNKVPAEMTLHRVLEILLYHPTPPVPDTPYFYGIIGPYAEMVEFEEGEDYTSLFEGNTVADNNNTPSTATKAFTKIESKVNSGTTIDIYPAAYYTTDGVETPAGLEDPHQYIIAVPKEYFKTSEVSENNWLLVKADNQADVTSYDGTQIASWTEIKINDIDYYVWDLHADANEDVFLVATYYVTTFHHCN